MGLRFPSSGWARGTRSTSGTDAAERAPLLEVLEAFYAAGARVIDSSPMYGSAERVTGELVAKLNKQHNTFFATKVWTSGREKGAAQIEQSMRLMRAPRLDLLQIHNLLDWRTHAATLRALKSEEKIRYTGVTHYTTSAHADLEATLRAEPFDFAQFNYSIATREAERRLLPFCQEHGVAVLINRPFEEGGPLHARAQSQIARLCRRIRLQQLGAILPQIHRFASGGDLRHPGDFARDAHEGQPPAPVSALCPTQRCGSAWRRTSPPEFVERTSSGRTSSGKTV